MAWTPRTMPPFMSKTPRPVARPSTTANGRAGERAEGEHGVVVADQQDARLARATPVHVRPGHAGDELGRCAETPFDQPGDGRRGGLDGDRVVGGRLDVDERLQVVEQRRQIDEHPATVVPAVPELLRDWAGG